MDSLNSVIAMAKDWTDPSVVRDAPERVPHVIHQLIDHCERLSSALKEVRQYLAESPYATDSGDLLEKVEKALL